jgi:hypothetical protein
VHTANNLKDGSIKNRGPSSADPAPRFQNSSYLYMSAKKNFVT